MSNAHIHLVHGDGARSHTPAMQARVPTYSRMHPEAVANLRRVEPWAPRA